MMKPLLTILFFLISNLFFAQKNEAKIFDVEFFKDLQNTNSTNVKILESGSGHIKFSRNDSIIYMSYTQNKNSILAKSKGNYQVSYHYYPDLKIQSKQETIRGMSRLGSLNVGIERQYDENGNILDEINWDIADIDENVPCPKVSIWQTLKQLKNDFNFDALNDDSLFSIYPYYDEKTKSSNYRITKFIDHKNDILSLLEYFYNGNTGNFMYQQKRDVDFPFGLHY